MRLIIGAMDIFVALIILNGFRKNAYGDSLGNLGTGAALFLVSGVLLMA